MTFSNGHRSRSGVVSALEKSLNLCWRFCSKYLLADRAEADAQGGLVERGRQETAWLGPLCDSAINLLCDLSQVALHAELQFSHLQN